MRNCLIRALFKSVIINIRYFTVDTGLIPCRTMASGRASSDRNAAVDSAQQEENPAKSCADDSETMSNSPNTSDSYILIDIGANLTNKKFTRDIDSVVRRAKDAGVQKIIVTGTSVHGSKEALRLTQMHPGTLYCTAGVHPHDAKSWEEDTASILQEIASNPECVAIGECGLDFNRNFSPPDVQIEACEKQVQLACLLKKPLFLHERDAHTQLVAILDKYKEHLPPAVIHCFTGTREEAQAYLALGLYIGLTGYLWKDKSEDGVRSILQDGVIPLDRLLVETDSPFMYPNTRASKLPAHVRDALSERSLNFLHRYCTFQRNEPCSLPVTVEMIAAYMKRKPEEVAVATSYSALKLFGMS